MVVVPSGKFAGASVGEAYALQRMYEDYIASPERPLSQSEIDALRAEKQQVIGQMINAQPEFLKQPPLGAQIGPQGQILNERELNEPRYTYYKTEGGKRVEISKSEYERLQAMQRGTSFPSMSGAIAPRKAEPFQSFGLGIMQEGGRSYPTSQPSKSPITMEQREQFDLQKVGLQKNPFVSGELIEIKSKKTPEQAAYENTFKFASFIYEKAPPGHKALLNLQSLWSERGFEYAFSYLPGSKKKPSDITKGLMTQSLLDKDFMSKQAVGAVFNTPTGVLGTSLFTGYGAGAIIGEILPRSSLLLSGANKFAGLIATHQAESLLVGGITVGGMEAFKLEGMKKSGFSQEMILGELGKDVISFAGFGEGFKVGLQEGLPFKFWGKKSHAASEFIEPSLLKGEENFPSSRESAVELLGEFKGGKFKFTEELGGWHATTSGFASETATRAGTSEHPGMFIAPSLSTHFLGIDAASYGPSAKASIGAGAKALWVVPEGGIKIVDVPFPDIGNMKTGKGFLFDTAGTPTGFIFSDEFPLRKPEKQAIIPPGVGLTRTSEGLGGFSDFVKIKDIRVPIMTYKTSAGEGTKVLSGFNFPGLKDVLSGSYSSGAVKTGLIASGVSTIFSKPSKDTASSSISIKKISSASSLSKISLSSSIMSKSSSPSISLPSMPKISSSFASKPSISPSVSVPSLSKMSSFSMPKASVSPSISKISSPSLSSFSKSFRPPTHPPNKKTPWGLPKGFGKRKSSFMLSGKQRLRYTPSIGGVLLGMKAGRPPKKVFTGIEIRPMIHAIGRKSNKRFKIGGIKMVAKKKKKK